ncbi:MAG TPA: sterol desaturase family protein [Acidimicrobiales bacterium]|nr:sterol desaturase family protein [Acidimicrobiales bacterium]
MDLTQLATPLYFGTMAIEHKVLARRAATRGPSAGDYAGPDTRASLTMGTASLALPLVTHRLVRAFAPGRGRWARGLIAGTMAAAVATTVADTIVRRRSPAGRPGPAEHAGTSWKAASAGAGPAASTRHRTSEPTDRAVTAVPATEPTVTASPAVAPASAAPATAASTGPAAPGWAVTVQRAGGVATVAGAVVLATATAAHLCGTARMWERGRHRDLGAGPLAWIAAIVGWDAIYYWNHRIMHEVRLQWAHHVVHHSSERYNLSTALRQPVSPFGVWVPYGLLCLGGVRPGLVEHARGLNLLYQYWIHTEAIDSLGPGEEVLNTPSHHRVHHGSNRRYLDRNHGSFLIVWDRLFGTFARESAEEPVVYGLTRNIDTFAPLRIVTHEYADMLRDVARSDTWRDRLSFVLRGPGWAYRRRAEREAPRAPWGNGSVAIPAALPAR